MKKIIFITALFAAFASCNTIPDSAMITNQYNVTSTSKIGWKGSATDHFHVGGFAVSGELLATPEGLITKGEFVIPIASITDYDLPDPVRQTLLDDLKSANFFNIALHPDTKFRILKVVPYNGSDDAPVPDANYLLTGNFTMLGNTHPVTFPAKVLITGKTISVKAKFKISRLNWGMNIYSDPVKPLYILPDVDIDLDLTAAKK